MQHANIRRRIDTVHTCRVQRKATVVAGALFWVEYTSGVVNGEFCATSERMDRYLQDRW